MDTESRMQPAWALLVCTMLALAGCGGSGGGEAPPLDTDGDGIADSTDATDTADFDGDGIGNNADDDDDNDGVADADDAMPLNAARTRPIDPLFPVVNGQFQLPTTPVATQLEWIIEQLAATSTSIADINARFDPATLAVVPAADWQAFFDTLRAAIPGGTVQDILTMTPIQARVLIGNASEPANGQFVTLTAGYASGLIQSFGASPFPLDGSSTGTADRALDYTGAADKLETLAEQVGVLVAEIDADNQCVPIFTRNDMTPLGTASVFKIWVLGAVAQAIEDGILTPTQSIPLVAENLALAGAINNEPLGTSFSLTDMATLMLGISDNSATDHLFRLTGRAANEAILTQFNFATPEVMLPFLSVNEAFHLYFTVPEMEATDYVTGTEQEQRDYVNDVLEPLGPVTVFTNANESVLVKATWQASPMDVCAAMSGLRQFPDTGVAHDVINEAFGAETAGINLRGRWERIWFKGGSLADGTGLRVLTYAWMLETDNRGTFAVIAMGNNDSGGTARIDQAAFASVALRLVDIVDETQ